MKFLSPACLVALLLVSAFLVFESCAVNDTTTNGKGHLNVQLTDAPAPYDAVYIDIQQVQVKPVNPNSDVKRKHQDNDGWITINDEPVRVNLLNLRNGDTIQLGQEELEAGDYTQIRLILGEDNAIVVAGSSYDLTTPSAQQSGLKLNIDASIKDDEVYNLLIDFDASRSIVATGSGKFILKPVLRAVRLNETGSIKGAVKPAAVQTALLAVAHGDTLSSFTNAEGKFTIMGVSTGTYNVIFEPGNSRYADTTITNITVRGDDKVDVGTITLPTQ